MTTVAERGRRPAAGPFWLAGQLLVIEVKDPSSPGCCTLMNTVW
jgi:hypothetical protein